MKTQNFYTLTNTGFIILIDFAWTTPKNTKLTITTPIKYDDHPYHPNIGSVPRDCNSHKQPTERSYIAYYSYKLY